MVCVVPFTALTAARRAPVAAAAAGMLALSAPTAVAAGPADGESPSSSASASPVGAAVTGTSDPAQAPRLSPGLYHDALPADASVRHYLVTRTPSSSTYISVFARPSATALGQQEEITIAVSLPDGRGCGKESRTRSFGDGSGFVTSYVLDAGERLRHPGYEAACRVTPELVVAVSRARISPSAQTTAAILIGEEPGPATLGGLPSAPATDAADARAIAAAEGEAVRLAETMSDAVTLAPGTYDAELPVPSEGYLRVRLDYGQSLAVTTQATAAPAATLQTQVFSPMWVPIDSPSHDRYPDRRVLDPAAPVQNFVNAFVPQVRYLNRTSYDDSIAGASIPGYYIVRVTAEANRAPEKPAPVPVRIAVAVDGEPVGGPRYLAPAGGGTATATPDASLMPSLPPGTTVTTATEDAGPSGPSVALGLAGLTAAIGAVTWWWTRRRQA